MSLRVLSENEILQVIGGAAAPPTIRDGDKIKAYGACMPDNQWHYVNHGMATVERQGMGACAWPHVMPREMTLSERDAFNPSWRERFGVDIPTLKYVG